MTTVPTGLRRVVVERAGTLCEYCRLAQAGQHATFHVDHIIPIAAGGKTVAENLALAFVACSLHKAARLIAVDPDSCERVPLFNPRTDNWREHFRWQGVKVIGQTAVGRATVDALAMNHPLAMATRLHLAALGLHPL